MPTPDELERKFWKSIASDMTAMLGIADGAEARGHMAPMTAQFDGEPGRGPIWFFTARDTELGKAAATGSREAMMCYTAKGHDLFACAHGQLAIDNDPAVIDRLWNRFVAAWFERGRTDPKLALLRFDPGHAEIWENASSLMAGVKLLFGSDPKEEFRDKVAEVNLG